MCGQIVLSVNGRPHRVAAEPDTPLLYVLRNDLGLKATKPGCGQGQCGACRVLIDGRAVPSCQVAVGAVGDRSVTTVEGLAAAERLHPVQRAFIQENAAQCGFCTSGMIITAVGLLGRNPSPDDEEILQAMEGSLCRCGSHERIRRAIRRAAGRPETQPAFEVRDAAGAQSDEAPAALPRPLAATPDLDRWVRIDAGGTVTLFSGKTELGQDIRTSLAMIGAEELDVPLERIRVILADTAQSPDEGYTASSMSLETSGNALRYATACARRIASLRRLASSAFPRNASPSGRARSATRSGRIVTYWDLQGGQAVRHRSRRPCGTQGAAAYSVLGRPTARLDIAAKDGRGPTLCTTSTCRGWSMAGWCGRRATRPDWSRWTITTVGACPACWPWCATAPFWGWSPSARSRPFALSRARRALPPGKTGPTFLSRTP